MKQFENDRATHFQEPRVFNVGPDGLTEEQRSQQENERAIAAYKANEAKRQAEIAGIRAWHRANPTPKLTIVKGLAKLVAAAIVTVLAGIGGLAVVGGVNNATKTNTGSWEAPVNYEVRVDKGKYHSNEECQAALRDKGNDAKYGYEIASWTDMKTGKSIPCVRQNNYENIS